MRYYSTQRPVGPGTFPKLPENKVLEVHNFDAKTFCEEIGREAWGYIDFESPLTQEQADNYELIASTEDVRVAAFHVGGEQTWGIQFHPEVYHSTDGTQLLKNFVVDICGCGQSWTSEGFVEATVRELREKLGDDAQNPRFIKNIWGVGYTIAG